MGELAGMLGVALLIAGCGEDPPTSAGGGDVDAGADSGADAGIGCAPGEQPLEAGGCLPAGVPPDGCGVGFVANDRAGCDAVMPDVACGPGLVALPGETKCHAIAPCGNERWADDLPDEPGTEFVDAAFTGTSDGSEAAPWKTIQEGVDAAAPGALVAVAAGAYGRTVVAGKAVRLWGKCPAEVGLTATLLFDAALELGAGSDGSLARGLALSGDGFGAYVSGAEDVKLERVWIHDTKGYGVYVDDVFGPASVAVSTSLVEAATIVGIIVEGATASIEDTAVTGTRPFNDDFGNGVLVLKSRKSGAAAGATITHCVIEENHTLGVQIAGAEVEVDSTLVRNNLENVITKESGDGFDIADDDEWHEPSKVGIHRSVIEQNLDTGVFVRASEATLDATVVRATKPRVSDSEFGRGVELVAGPAGRARVTLRQSLVHDNHEMGVMVTSSDLVVESAIVLETQPNAATQAEGFGIYIQKGSGERADGKIRWSVVRSNHDIGIAVAGSDAEILGSVVEGTLARVSDGAFGRGIQVQLDLDDNDRGVASIASTLVADNVEGGVMVFGADVTLDASWVRGTRARASTGEYGDGVVVAGLHTPKVHGDGTLRVTGSRIEDNARAGIANFSGSVTLAGATLECNPIPLDGEDFLGAVAAFDDLGGNVCGCDGAAVPCKVLKSNLAAPDDLP